MIHRICSVCKCNDVLKLNGELICQQCGHTEPHAATKLTQYECHYCDKVELLSTFDHFPETWTCIIYTARIAPGKFANDRIFACPECKEYLMRTLDIVKGVINNKET